MSADGSVLSPLDGRYRSITEPLRSFFSEKAFCRYRLYIEVEYLRALYQRSPVPVPDPFPPDELLDSLWKDFGESGYARFKELEAQTRHDIKALELYLAEQFRHHGYEHLIPFIHWGLTSQDVTHPAWGRMWMDSHEQVLFPVLKQLIHDLKTLAHEYARIPLLARTHGQPASPTTLGKEFAVYVSRLRWITTLLFQHPVRVKFGGATGTLATWTLFFPDFNWNQWADDFIHSLGLERESPTTQISHYDGLAHLVSLWIHLATILLDLAQDIWLYLMQDVFILRRKQSTEVGSSTMPHKVNPIFFENAEGNLHLARNLGRVFVEKLPVSRLQRDLSDSTILRNTGIFLGYILVAMEQIREGLSRLQPHIHHLQQDLNKHYEVLAEAIQTALRLAGNPDAYFQVKDLFQGKQALSREEYLQILQRLPLPSHLYEKLAHLTPEQYIGLAETLAHIQD